MGTDPGARVDVLFGWPNVPASAHVVTWKLRLTDNAMN
jgi:hypothetical protein